MQRGSRRSKSSPKKQVVAAQKSRKSPAATHNGKKSKAKGSDAAEDAAPCSRVCIKNLPEKFTNEKLRKYCESSVGRVTDVKIMHKNGVSRKFAFVGFETPESAAKAVTHLNRTFIQTSKISVEFARRIGQRPPTQGSASARPWSKHSLGSSRHRALHPEQYVVEDADDKSDDGKKKKKKKDKKNKKGKKNHGGDGDAGNDDDSASKISDKKLLEFLRVFVPKKGKSWANDDLVMNAAHEQQGREVSSSEDDSDADQMESDSDDGSDGDQGTKKNITTSSSSSASSSSKVVGGGDASSADVDLAETGRLFIRNLPFTVTEEELEKAFSKFGHLSELHLPRDAQQRIKGFAFVAYTRPEHAVKAHGEMDGQFFRGRIMHVIPAREKVIPVDPNAPRDSRDHGGGAGDSYKAKKAAELREAAEDKDIWSTLFIRSDTAVGVIAEQMGLGKSDILDRESSGSMAVRAALSETHVISQTKRLLEEEGVNLVALERAARGDAAAAAMPRSKRASKEEFSELFSPFGQTLRIVFPAVRTIALVEFLNPSSAKAAFRKLAYKRFMHVPLYLEWAPLDIFGEEGAQGAVEAPVSKHRAAKDGGESGAAAVTGDEDVADAEESSTLFVKNLNFDTTSESLEAAFKRRVSGVRSAKIVTRMDKKRGALSTGYGFVEFASPSHVMEALKKMQGMELDGHVLELKFSKGKTAGVSRKRKRPAAAAATAAGSETTAAAGGDDGSAGKKLLVKNLAFESSNKELRQLFGSFGQLKSVRMPRKFDGGHRGFAFVEYTTHKDARSAMAELANTHFYGRHLVVDWAKETGGVEDARLQSAKDAKSIKARRADEEAASAMAGSKDNDEFGL